MGTRIKFWFPVTLCTLMVFFLCPASSAMLLRSLRSQPTFTDNLIDSMPSIFFPEDTFFSTNGIDDGNSKKMISVHPSDESFETNSADDFNQYGNMLQQISSMMQQLSDRQKDSIKDNSDKKIFEVKNIKPSAEEMRNIMQTTSPFKIPRVHPKMLLANKNDHKSGDSKNNHSLPSLQPLESLDKHLNHMWSSAIPLLMKNNKASVFSKPDFDHMSKVLPGLPPLMEKLNQVHKPGHVTIMMVDPKHMPADREVANEDIPFFTEPLQASPDDKVSPTLHSFLRSLLKNNPSEVEPARTTPEDYHGVDNVDSTWSDEEKDLISLVMNNLHLFDKPDHLSAVSFNPRHIVKNENNPTIFNIDIKINLPPPSSSHGFEPMYHEEPFDLDSALEPFSESLFNEPKQINNPAQSHRKREADVHQFQLRNFLDNLEHSESPYSTQLPKEAPKKTGYYFIMHPQHSAVSEPTQPTPNIHSLLSEMFNIPLDMDFPNEDFEHQMDDSDATSRQFFDNPFVNSPASQQADPSQLINEVLSNLLAPNDVSAEAFPRMLESLSAPPLQGTSQDDLPPLEFFKYFNPKGMSYLPQDQSFDQEESVSRNILPTEGIVPIHIPRMRMRIIPLGQMN